MILESQPQDFTKRNRARWTRIASSSVRKWCTADDGGAPVDW